MKFILLLFLVFTIPASCQTVKNGTAKASGACSVAHSGNYDTITIQHCGIGEKQGNQIIDLLNKLKDDRSSDKFSEKLDQLIELASKPYQIQNCVGSNCLMNGTQYNYDQRTYRAPKPGPKIVDLKVTASAAVLATPYPQYSSDPATARQQAMDWKTKVMNGQVQKGSNPGLSFSFQVDGAFQNPMFLVQCDRPCKTTSVGVFVKDQTTVIFDGHTRNIFLGTDNPNIWLMVLGDYSILTSDLIVSAGVLSLDAQPLKDIVVESYIQ